MRRHLVSIDRLSDRPVMFTVAVLTAGGAAIAWTMLHATESGRWLAEGLAGFSALLLLWGLFGRAVDRSRRVKLDRAVDDEMGKKWGPGFAKTVGVYEKPWYLLCGETGVGKTAALRAGRLPMAIGPDGNPVTDASQGMNGTFMFDWWFYEDAVVLDSAGDLIANPDERWSAFLDRIHDARPARPINGMILSVSAEDLLGDVETVREKADLLARQVEVARERLHVRFPLYLLVTKSDLITGFSDYFPAGSDLKSSFQILGWSNPQDPRNDDRQTPSEAVRAGLDGVVTDLRRRRSLSMARTTSARTDADLRIDHLDEMFAFPAAVAGCLDNLQDFIAKLLERSGTVAPPFLRGVYFTSALRTGDALDVELRNAFGVEQLPAGRRKPSDRAFFLRDLLLEKIVPEAGMVAPLQDVVTASHRRTRMVIGVSVIAASAVLAVTAMGFRKTVGRVQVDRDFWQTLELKDGSPEGLALFGPDGSYHGRDKLPSGKTVLATHEQAASLAKEVTSSSLLPLSAELDHDRKEAHADLFRQAVLVPALTPALPNPAVSADRVAVLTKLYTDTQTPDAIPVQALRDDAIAMLATAAVPPDDKAELQKLLETGVPARDDAGKPAATVRLPTADRARIATAIAAWVEKYTSDRREAVRVPIAQGRATLEQAHKFEEADRRFAQAFGPDGTAAQRDAVIAEMKSPGPVSPMAPVSAELIAPAPEMNALRKVVGDRPMTEASSRIMLAAAGYTASLGTAEMDWYDAATGTTNATRPQKFKDLLPAELARVDRDDLTLIDGKPAVQARLDRDRAVLATAAALGDVKSRFDKIPSPYPHPYFRLPAVLSGIESDIASQVKAFGPGGGASADASRRILTTASQTARDAAWKLVIDSPTAIFLVADPAGGPAKPLNVEVTAIPSTDLCRAFAADPKATPTLRDWIVADKAVTASELPVDPRIRLSAHAVQTLGHTQLAMQIGHYVSAWDSATRAQRSPNLEDWKDLAARIGPTADPAKISAGIDRMLAPAIEAIDTVSAFDGQSKLSLSPGALNANDVGDRLKSPVGSHERVEAICDFLNNSEFATGSAQSVRAKLLANPAELDRRLTVISGLAADPRQANFRDAFWNNLLVRSVDLLVAENKPPVAAALTRIHTTAEDCYPLVQTGTKSWSGDTKALRADLAMVGSNGSTRVTTPLAIRIRDLDLIDADWAEYLNYLNLLCDKLDKPLTGSIKIEKENSLGNWNAVAIGAVGKPVGRTFTYDKSMKPTPINDAAMLRDGLVIQLLDSPDRPVVMAEIVDADAVNKPWSLLRLATQKQPVRLTVRSDEVTDKFYGINVTTSLPGFADMAVPSRVPDAPAVSPGKKP